MPTAFNTISDELRKYYAQDQEKQIADSNSFYAAQVNSTNKLYDAQVDKQSKAYEDKYRENAIQKLINERQVAENMANLGLTNSGLNRTQQTAVQLSYANNKADLDRQKQSAVNDINLARTQALDTIEQNRLSGEATIKQNFEDMINKTAQSMYEKQIEAKNQQIAQQQQNSYIIKKNDGILSRDYMGDLSSNGVDVIYDTEKGTATYTDRNSGFSSTFPINKNPYTNTVNPDTEFGTFKNGYQPNNKNGIPLKIEDTTYIKELGKEQNVFKTEETIGRRTITKYWIWDGSINEYVKAVKKVVDGEKKWVII